MDGNAWCVWRVTRAGLAAALLCHVSLAPAVAQAPAVAPAAGEARAAAGKAELSATTTGGFARLVFHFDQQIPADVKITGGVLVIAFAQPVDVQVNQLTTLLRDYVTAVRRDPDGKSLRFALAQRVTVNSMEAGERLFVDMMPDNWRGLPPGLPVDVVEELTRRAREAERRARLAESQRVARTMPPVTVRVGNHPTFSRFVFSLPEPAAVSIDRNGDRLTLRVAKPFTSDLRHVRDALPPFVGEIEADTGTDELVFRMAVSPQADVRAFREEGTYVLDLTMRGAPAGTRDPAALAQARQPGLTPPAVTMLPGNVPTPPLAAARPAMPPPAPAPMRAVPQPAPREAARAPAVAEAPRPAAQPPAEPAPTPAVAAAPAPAAAPPAPPRVETADPAPRPASQPAGPVAMQARRAGGTVRILVPFTRETPGAIFQRGDTLWLVFDTIEEVALAGLQAEAAGIFSSVDASRSQTGIAVRIGLERQSLASAGRDGLAWIVTLADSMLEPPRPVHLARATDQGDKLIATADFPQAGSVHRLSDPLAGDTLIVVTGAGPARSFVQTREMVEFTALAGSHGLVFQPIADDLSVTISGDQVNVGRPFGLQLSAGLARPPPVQRLTRRPRTITFDLELWAVDERAPFRERESDLLANAAAVHDTQRTARRLDLVRFYMAQQRWAEAKAVLDAIVRQDRRIAEDGTIQGLRGVVSIMMHRPADALREFSHPAMANAPDVALWRATALAMDGRTKEAHDAFEGSDVSPATLPHPLARAILVRAIEAALDSGAVDRADKLLSDLQEIGIPPTAEQQFALLRGRVIEAKGMDRDALVAYARAANGPDLPVRADAENRLLAARYRLGEIDRKAAIEELEVQSYAWRGDEVEARTLALLAKLYADQGQFREAFTTMRLAMRAHPRSESVRGMQDDVARHFERLFLDGNADQMKPVDALALYYDFRDMTPQGRRGDEIIRRLADRLAGMDLLDQAAALLQHQIDRRLQGAARSQVAARLALIHLSNRKPAAALQALRATRLADLPEELRVQRYLLEARAHADSGRPDQALEMLSGIRTPEAEMLRADIHWGAQRHRESAEQSERWVSARAGNAPLGSDERRHLLRAAIGYALVDDALGLDRLRSRWREAMKGTPDERAFDVVTSPIDARGVEYREIARSIADRDTLDAFLKNYRERYPSETPGAGTPQQQSDTPTGATPRQG
jgi:tetratricopeptide (TPR) repeat protein